MLRITDEQIEQFRATHDGCDRSRCTASAVLDEIVHLRAVEKAAEDVAVFLRTLDCGDNGCVFAVTKGGMRTNGGCRCIETQREGRSRLTGKLQRMIAALGAAKEPTP